MARDNIFTGIEFPSAKDLETDVNKLNSYKGVVDSLGGIISGVQKKQEENNFVNYNKALQNATTEGDIDLLKGLVNYSNQFTDPTMRKEAKDLSTRTHDQIAINNFNRTIQEATNTGNTGLLDNISNIRLFDPTLQAAASKSLLDAQNSIATGNVSLSLQEALLSNDPIKYNQALEGIRGLTIPNAQKAKLLGEAGSQGKELEAFGLANDYYKQFATGGTLSPNEVNTFKRVQGLNPAFKNAVAISDTGSISRKAVTQQEVQNALGNLSFTDPSYKDKYNEKFKELSDLREKQYQGFLAASIGAGITPIDNRTSIDEGIRKIRAAALDKNLSPDQADKAVARFTSLAQNMNSMGPEAKARYEAQLAQIDRDSSLDLEQATANFNFLRGLDDKERISVLKNLSKTKEDLYKEVDTYGDIWFLSLTSQNDRNTLKDEVNSLLDKKYSVGNNQERNPTPEEVITAMQSLRSSPWYDSSKKSLNVDNLENAVKAQMTQNLSLNKIALKEAGLREIEEYYKVKKEIQNKSDAAKLQAQSLALAGSPSGVNKLNNELKSLYDLLNKPATNNSNTPLGTLTPSLTNFSQRTANQGDVRKAEKVINTVKPEAINTIVSILKNESNGNTNAVSSAGAIGLMQITLDTAKANSMGKDLFKFADEVGVNYKNKSNKEITKLLTDPLVNTNFGIAYLDSIAKKVGANGISDNMSDEHLAKTLVGYNYGPGRANITRVPKETYNYMTAIFKDLGRTVPKEYTWFEPNKASKG